MKDSQSQPWLRNIVLGMEENRKLARRCLGLLPALRTGRHRARRERRQTPRERGRGVLCTTMLTTNARVNFLVSGFDCGGGYSIQDSVNHD
jgi:hypothetical protein